MARELFGAISQQRPLRPSFLSLMIFRIQQLAWEQAADPDSCYYAYWEERGWFDPDTTFYIEHRAGPVRVALAPPILTVTENVGRSAVLVLPFFFSLDLSKRFAVPTVVGMGLALTLYYASWIRYFAGGRAAALFAAPLFLLVRVFAAD